MRSNSKRPKKERIRTNGDAEDNNRQESPIVGPRRDLLWAGLYSPPDIGLREANLLGAGHVTSAC